VAAERMRRKTGLFSRASCVRVRMRTAYGYLVIYRAARLRLMCLAWSGAAALLCHVLSISGGECSGAGHELWISLLSPAPRADRGLRFDLRALDALRDATLDHRAQPSQPSDA